MAHNKLVGTIPSEISQLTQLSTLYALSLLVKSYMAIDSCSLKCWAAYQRVSPPSEFPDFFTNFHRHKNVFILGRFENFWVFWKAMSLSHSFLHSTSCGVRFWYPFGTHPSRRYLGLVFGSVFDRFCTSVSRNWTHGGTQNGRMAKIFRENVTLGPY